MNERQKLRAINREDDNAEGADFDTIMADAKIQDILQRKPSYRERIEKAVRILAGKENAIKAAREAAGAIINHRINVFFSYKSEDEDSARIIVDELRAYAGKTLKITFAAEFTEEIAGARWNRAIRDAIYKAHWFILLMPDPAVKWDWCLFETGMFSGKMVSDRVNKLICLHHPAHTELPPQIRDFQAVSGDPADIEAFLRNIFVKDNPMPGMDAINPEIKNRLPKIAAEIAGAIKPRNVRLNREILDHHILIKVQNARDIQGPEDLESSSILEIDKRLLSIFGKNAVPRTWGDLVNNVTGKDKDCRWLRELAAAVRKTAEGNTFGPIQATFKGADSGKLFRPLLHAIDKDNDDEIESFMILFLEEIGVGLTHHIPETTQALISTLRLTFRFRWEIINRYKTGMTVDQVQEFKDSLDRIETESKSRGFINADMLAQSFGGDRIAADRVRSMFTEWNDYRNDERTGLIDIAIREKNVEVIMEILNKVAVMNSEFVIMAIERMESLIQSDQNA